MLTLKRFVSIALTSGLLLFLAGDVLHAEDIEGTIVRTLLLSEDTRLVGDVTCRVEGAACIAFGAPGITLSLNGFTMTGLANATTGCSGANVTGEFGISTNNQSDVGVRGPGMVQRFRANGIIFAGTVRGRIEGVTASTNCLSGILVNAASSQIRVEANVLVRNGAVTTPVVTAGAGRGGISIFGSDNRIRWNETGGNGYADPADDHGIGILSGNNNVIEGNTAIGNTNGIILFPASTNTLVRLNVVVGNPPIQVSVSLPTSNGFDILNLSAPGMSSFDRNLCITAVAAPCPDLSTSPVPRRPQN
jgi:parallel beta-helix repeat protein